MPRKKSWLFPARFSPPDAKLPIVKTLWHFARGSAMVAGKQVDQADKELAALRAAVMEIPEDAPYGNRNKARKVLVIPEQVLAGRLALAAKQNDEGIKHLRRAIQVEDELNYHEPADWHLPVRETLGAAYLQLGDPAAAEKVFRNDLDHNRRNGRALFGLAAALEAQAKSYEAGLVRQEFDAAWRNADVKLQIDEY